MATKRYFECSKKHRASAAQLFDSLRAIAKGKVGRCVLCGGGFSLKLDFPFGLGATKSKCTVLHAFNPRRTQTWRDAKGRRVKFYPFLVIVARHGKERAIWMPYWHLVYTKRGVIKKYGQWAPFMDEHLFRSLLAQAKLAEPSLFQK